MSTMVYIRTEIRCFWGEDEGRDRPEPQRLDESWIRLGGVPPHPALNGARGVWILSCSYPQGGDTPVRALRGSGGGYPGAHSPVLRCMVSGTRDPGEVRWTEPDSPGSGPGMPRLEGGLEGHGLVRGEGHGGEREAGANQTVGRERWLSRLVFLPSELGGVSNYDGVVAQEEIGRSPCYAREREQQLLPDVFPFFLTISRKRREEEEGGGEPPPPCEEEQFRCTSGPETCDAVAVVVHLCAHVKVEHAVCRDPWHATNSCRPCEVLCLTVTAGSNKT